jgi:indolepyruvate ferredoxin oxidoreductase alpha subunit
MTGHQQHPATGKTIKNEDTYQLDIVNLCRACGAKSVNVIDSLDITGLEKLIKQELNFDGVSVIIAKRPCVLLDKGRKNYFVVNDKCTNCKCALKQAVPQ